MQRWVVEDNVALPDLDDGAGLHTSERTTDCVTQALFYVIKQAAEAAASKAAAT